MLFAVQEDRSGAVLSDLDHLGRHAVIITRYFDDSPDRHFTAWTY